MATIKRIMLVALSVVFIMTGALGIADVQFFTSNILLELLEIILGIVGLIISVR